MRAASILLVASEVSPEFAADYTEWYNREHLPDMVRRPGFLGARRYYDPEAEPAYLALYEGRTADTFCSAAYLDLLANLSPWSRRVIPRFQRPWRMVYRVTACCLEGVGGGLALVRASALPLAVDAGSVTSLGQKAGRLGALWLEADLAVSNAVLGNRAVPTAGPVRYTVALAVQCMDRTEAQHVIVELLASGLFPGDADIATAAYGLLCQRAGAA
jgi:hypothetical protein